MRNAFQLHTILAATLVGLLFSNAVYGQNESPSFVLKLNDNLIKSFKDYGSLRSQLPAQAQGRIDNIELRYEGTEGQEPTEMALSVEVKGESAQVYVGDSVLETLRRQPIRIPLQGKAFNTIFLRYRNGDAAEEGGGIVMGDGPNRFVLEITDDSSIAGSVVDMTEITLMTNFGEVQLTLDQIAGVRFNADGEDGAVVFLNNGDAISGTPTLGVVNVQTFWGLAEVNATNVRSMSASPSAKYVRENTDFGVRWQLKTGNALAPGPGS